MYLVPLSHFPSTKELSQMVKSLPAMREIRGWSLGPDDPLEKEMATHSSILAWRIPWTEEPGGLQSTGSQSRTRLSDFTNWRQEKTSIGGRFLSHGTYKTHPSPTPTCFSNCISCPSTPHIFIAKLEYLMFQPNLPQTSIVSWLCMWCCLAWNSLSTRRFILHPFPF